MTPKVITAVTAYPVSLTEARLHIKCTDDTLEDALIETWIAAAFEFAEHYTGRALAPQTLEMALDCFPYYENDIIKLDMPPVVSITSVKYTDADGVEQTIAPADYALSLYGDSRRLAPTFGNYWPSTQAIPDAVRIRYVAGYITATQTSAVKAAMLLTIGHLYEHRQDVSAITMEEIPLGARSLLNTVKIWSR